MILDLEAMFYDMLGNSFVTSHLEKKIKFDVVKSDKVGSKFKEAVKKEYNAKFLDDSEYVIRFAEPVAENPTDDNEEDTDNKDNQEGDENQGENADTENGGEENADAEEVNESIKVQDLTSTMLSTPKGTKTKATSKKVSKSVSKKCTKESEGDDEKEDEKKDTKKKEVKTEAETEATGDELKNKVKKAIVRTFNIQDANKVELNDLPDFIEGYNVYFTKLSIKAKEENSEG